MEAKMKVLKMAIQHERWDLAAHVIILEAAIQLEKGGKNGWMKRENKADNEVIRMQGHTGSIQR